MEGSFAGERRISGEAVATETAATASAASAAMSATGRTERFSQASSPVPGADAAVNLAGPGSQKSPPRACRGGCDAVAGPAEGADDFGGETRMSAGGRTSEAKRSATTSGAHPAWDRAARSLHSMDNGGASGVGGVGAPRIDGELRAGGL